MSRAIILPIVFALTAMMSRSALADQYVGGSSTFAVFIAWTSDGAGHLQGQVQTATLAGPKVDRLTSSFTGTRNGPDVSLVFPLLSSYSGETWTGSFGFRSLTLQLPNVAELQLSAGSFDDFRNRVASLDQTASVAAAAAADAAARAQRIAAAQAAHAQRIAAAQAAVEEVSRNWNSAKQRLINALAQLKAMFPIPPPDPSNPKTFRAKYAKAVSRMEDAWTHEQELASVTPLTCYQKSQVQYAASQVSYTYSQLHYEDTEFATFDRTAGADLLAARSAIDTMDAIYPTYETRYHDYRQLVPSAPAPQLTRASIDKMERDLRPLLDQYEGRLSVVRGVAKDADSSGDSINAKAADFPGSLSCSG